MKKILVIVDMQNDFLTGALGNAECQKTIPAVVAQVRTGDYDKVFLTQDTHAADYLNTREGKNLPVEHCIEGTEGWKVNAEVLSAVDEVYGTASEKVSILTKPTFGSVMLAKELEAFYEKDKDLHIDFVGVCTGICVISNVMLAKAYCPEAELRVLSDACACVTTQSHVQALEAMKLCQVLVE